MKFSGTLVERGNDCNVLGKRVCADGDGGV